MLPVCPENALGDPIEQTVSDSSITSHVVDIKADIIKETVASKITVPNNPWYEKLYAPQVVHFGKRIRSLNREIP